MKSMTVPNSWLEVNGRRLDGRPYHSGAAESRVLLEELPVGIRKLLEVTKNEDGIFNGPRFARMYVKQPEFGTPFLGSTDILLSDLSMLPLLSKKYVANHPELLIDTGWTLITCSGTIGRMAFARPEMKNMAGSQHFMRVVPDNNKVRAGYLYSFLSSRFGLPMVIGMTYGAIIQHIEPHHLADLPVPELGEIEEKSHQLCVDAAQMRTEASLKFAKAGSIINETFQFPKKIAFSARNFSITKATSIQARSRLEATYHDWVAQQSDFLVSQISKADFLHKIADVGETDRMREIFATPEFGVPFLTSSEIFLLNFEPKRFLSRKFFPSNNDWAVKESDILLARSGQVGGIIGHGVWADRRYSDSFVSAHVLRLSARKDEILPGYLFAYLCLTDVGYRQIVRNAAGSSIPFLSRNDILSLRIPRAERKIEQRVHNLVVEAGQLRADSQKKEDEARLLVENAIEELAHHG